MIVQQNGNTVAVELGKDTNIYFDWESAQTGTWSGWASLGNAGGGFVTIPAVLVQPSGNTVVTAVGADGNLYLNWENVINSVWSGWQNLGTAGGGFKLMPAMIERQNGNSVLIEVGADTNVYFNWQQSNGIWAGWAGLGNAGGGFFTTPAVLIQPGGNTVVTAVGADGNLYLNWENASNSVWSGWQNLGASGGGFWSTPAMIEQQNGNTVLVATALDQSVYFDWQMSNGTWAGWGGLGSAGGGFTTSPAALVQPNGNTVVTAIGADGNLYLNWQNASTEAWSGWGNLGAAGGGFTTPAMIEQHNGNTVLVDIGADESVYFDWQSASTEAWSGWGNLGEAGGGFISLVSLSGQITAGGSGLSGVTVTLTGSTVAATSFSQSTTTNFNGNYAFSVSSDGSYTVTPSLAGYTFSPASYEFDDLSENEIADFTQTVSSSTSQIWNGLIIPDSTTATPSASGCGDISGTWTETDQYGSSTWNLTEDTSGNVSGTVNFTNGGSCGTITYQTVTGSQSNGVFTLTASNPTALQDSCGYPITPTEQQSITLSTSGSCTTGSANWSSEFGAGTSTWKGQIPSSLGVVSNGVHVYTNAEAIAAGFESNCSGIVIGITYQVLDKNGNPYKVAGLVPQEMLSNGVEDGIPQHPSILDPPIWFQFVDIYPGHPEKNTNAAGIFSDAPFGACHGGNTVHTASDTQQIRLVNPKNAGSWIVRTNNWQYKALGPGHGSVTNNVDVSASR